MNPERWARIKALFTAALEVPESQRAAFLMAEVADDHALLAEVQSLLESHGEPGAFLEGVPHPYRALALAASGATRSRIGERIGAYRIVGVLGTGGMGDVFKAVRDDDQYHAEVAIKLMRADVRSDVVERRFRTERQILAGLDHRNIARLLDGGTTGEGVPYVVMELVAGEPIDRYCAERKLPVRERVQLFLQVCAAVSYAHAHLVVHRDLKPNNILATADGSVKLLDFGIAKLLEADGDTHVVNDDRTVTQMRAMTLEYASPEQVAGGIVTTVSDVYSLGVVLYRLLTGKSPYAPRTNDAQRVAEILSDTTPPRPSAVMVGDSVRRDIDADLDNILLMALRKEPAARYGSVEQFGNDLRNYLSGMPVYARGNALRYRAGKFLRRRKVEIAAGVVVACSLIGGMAVAIREARIAENERLVAEQHFASVRKLANTLLFELHDEMEKVPGSIKTRELLVKTSLTYLDSLSQEAGADAALKEELAVGYTRIAAIQGSETSANTGNYRGAVESYARAIALLEPLVASDPANHRTGMLLARTYVQGAQLMLVVSSPQEALVLVEKGVALSESLAPASADEAGRAEDLRLAYTAHADILAALGRSPEAMAAIDKLLGVAEAYWQSRPEDETALWLLVRAYNNAAIHADTRLSDAAAYERSLSQLRRVLWATEKLDAIRPDSQPTLRRLTTSRYNLARQLYAARQYTESLELYRLAAAAATTSSLDADDAQAQYVNALVQSGFGRALLQAGAVEEARVILVQSGQVLKPLAENGGTLRVQWAHGQNAVRLGELYEHLASDRRLSGPARLGYWRQAQDSLRQGVTTLKTVTDAVHIEPIDRAVLDDGAAALTRTEAAIARLAPAS